jgi:hypothetical protein
VCFEAERVCLQRWDALWIGGAFWAATVTKNVSASRKKTCGRKVCWGQDVVVENSGFKKMFFKHCVLKPVSAKIVYVAQ